MQSWKEIIGLLKDAVEVVALIVGGFWTYWLFVQKRERWPKACLNHHIRSWPIANDRQLIRVGFDIHNAGEVLLEIREGFTEIYQLKPWPQELITKPMDQIGFRIKGATEFQWSRLAILYLDGKSTKEQQTTSKDWPEFDGYDIEPDEYEEICFDFIIPAEVELVPVYSRIENLRLHDKEFGWNLTTLFDTRKQEMIANTKDSDKQLTQLPGKTL